MTVFVTGNTGRSTGPHLDFRVYNPATGGYEDPSGYTSYLTVGEGQSPFDFQVTSGYQPGGRVHPVTGEMKPHPGIDYATPEGTRLNVNGKLLSTWQDAGGGIMSQYGIKLDDGSTRELLLLHGSTGNPITGTGALDDYDLSDTAIPITVKPDGDTPDGETPQVKAKEKAKAYKDMSKAEMNAAYDAMRSDPNKAAVEGLKMHKAFFNKK